MSASPARVPILMYHEISAQPPSGFERWAISPRAFALQMRWLALNRYTPVTLDVLCSWLAGNALLPRRPVVITFDDGFLSVYQHALPVLRRHGFPATIFLISGLMGGSASWLEEASWRALPLMSWAQAREVERWGITLGAHTVNHPKLATLEPAAALHELRESRARIEDVLGHPVAHVAYPYGSWSPVVRDLAVEAGFTSACTTDPAFVTREHDVLALPRIEVSGTETFADFAVALHTAVPLRRSVRYRVQRLLRARR